MKSQHILNAASSLLGVSLLIVTFVHVTGQQAESLTDEVAFAAALLFLGACLMSYRAIRAPAERSEKVADYLFLAAQVLLLCAVLLFWF
jgi:uncharacterized membrane protein SirB2